MNTTIVIQKSPSVSFRKFREERNFKFSNSFSSSTNEYASLYGEWIRTLDPISLNKELRNTPFAWKQEVILRIIKSYKEQHDEDWLIC